MLNLIIIKTRRMVIIDYFNTYPAIKKKKKTSLNYQKNG